MLPPALAIVIEALSPFRERYFSGQASQIMNSQIGQPQPGDCEADVRQALSTVHTVLKTSLAGAASIAGLAPTIVSFIMTAITVFYSIADPIDWMLGLAAVAIVTVLAVIRAISGKNLFELEAEKLRMLGKPRIKPTKLFSWLIYLTNGVVMAGFTSVYWGWLS